jgi:hypothetical protein
VHHNQLCVSNISSMTKDWDTPCIHPLWFQRFQTFATLPSLQTCWAGTYHFRFDDFEKLWYVYWQYVCVSTSRLPPCCNYLFDLFTILAFSLNSTRGPSPKILCTYLKKKNLFVPDV